MSQRLDRRRFLLGTGGAMLAIPMLESLAPRRAFAQTVAPPKRLLIIANEHGRCVGGGPDNLDLWSPGAASGPYAAPGRAGGLALSRMLQDLAPIVDKIVTIDGVDNIVRHATGNPDGHNSPSLTTFTCVLPDPRARTEIAGGPSIDFVAGRRLAANATMRPSIVFPASAHQSGDFGNQEEIRFWTDARSGPYVLTGNPREDATALFGSRPTTPTMPPPRPSLRDRLAQSRGSVLDGVTQSLTALSARVNAHDRMQLESHAAFIRTLEMRQSGTGTGTSPSMGCTPPDATAAPAVPTDGRTSPAFARGASDPVTIPFTVRNLVQALACDLTRVAVLDFNSDYSFASEFPSGTPFSQADSWHGTIHNTGRDSPTDNENVIVGYRYFARVFVQVIQALEAVREADGTSMLDNTCVVWTSELGYGSHRCGNLPVVLAGLGGAFAKGRHVVENRRTTGDLWAHVLRLLGGSDTTFGATGTLGALASGNGVSNLVADLGQPGYVSASTQLHRGPLSL
jgi:hypothetical protein